MADVIDRQDLCFLIMNGGLDLVMKFCMRLQFWSIAQTIAPLGHDEEGASNPTRMHEVGTCIHTLSSKYR